MECNHFGYGLLHSGGVVLHLNPGTLYPEWAIQAAGAHDMICKPEIIKILKVHY